MKYYDVNNILVPMLLALQELLVPINFNVFDYLLLSSIIHAFPNSHSKPFYSNQLLVLSLNGACIKKKMSDLGAFKNESFSSSDWINEALADMTDDEMIDSFLASTAMKLHMISQEYTDQLESSMMEFMSIVPKTLHLLNDTEESIISVQSNLENMSGSSNDLNRVGNGGEAGSSMNAFDKAAMLPNIDDLSRLDITKSNMKRCIDVLKEHAYWNQLVRETSLFLENGGRLVDVAEK